MTATVDMEDALGSSRSYTRGSVEGDGAASAVGREMLTVFAVILLPLMVAMLVRAAQGLPIDTLLYRILPFVTVVGVAVVAVSLRVRLGRVTVTGDMARLATMWEVITRRRPDGGGLRVLRVDVEDDRVSAVIGRSVYTFNRSAWPQFEQLTADLQAAIWTAPGASTRPPEQGAPNPL